MLWHVPVLIWGTRSVCSPPEVASSCRVIESLHLGLARSTNDQRSFFRIYPTLAPAFLSGLVTFLWRILLHNSLFLAMIKAFPSCLFRWRDWGFRSVCFGGVTRSSLSNLAKKKRLSVGLSARNTISNRTKKWKTINHSNFISRPLHPSF